MQSATPQELAPKTFSQVMRDAAALIEKRGQCKGSLYGWGPHGEEPLCTWAAVFEAKTGRRCPWRSSGASFTPEHERLQAWLNRQDSMPFGICFYNNHHSKEQVMAMLHKAAVEA